MKRWRVITPEYGEVIPVTDEGQGPMEYGCDAIEVEAETRRDAVVVGVALMRRQPREYHWFRRCDGNPFAGIRAEEVNVAWEAHCETCDDCFNHPDGECDVARALRGTREAGSVPLG